MKYFAFVFLFLCLALPAFSQSVEKQEFTLMMGYPVTIESGAATTVSLSGLLFESINGSLDLLQINNIYTRAVHSLGIQIFLGSSFFGTFPHEFFGHEMACLDAGIQPDFFRMNFPLPGGRVEFTTTYAQSTPEQRMMIASSGPEVTAFIAYDAVKKLYSGKAVPSYTGNFLIAGKLVDSLIYWSYSLDAFVHDPENYPESAYLNDNFAYALALTEKYGHYSHLNLSSQRWPYKPSSPGAYVNGFLTDLNTRMWTSYLLQALDPALIYFFLGNYDYIVHGKTRFEAVMFEIGPVRWMPSIRADLGLVGPENYYDLFLLIGRKLPMNFYVRTGGCQDEALYGFGFEIRNIRWNILTCSLQADYWKADRSSAGFNLYIETAFDCLEFFKPVLAVGYKTEGHLMGKSPKEGPYGYAGFNLFL